MSGSHCTQALHRTSQERPAAGRGEWTPFVFVWNFGEVWDNLYFQIVYVTLYQLWYAQGYQEFAGIESSVTTKVGEVWQVFKYSCDEISRFQISTLIFADNMFQPHMAHGVPIS